jgi:hypothetical protein
MLTLIDVKPRVSADGSLVIKDGRHPLVEKAMKDQAFVSNSTVSVLHCTLIDTGVLDEVFSSSSTRQAHFTVSAMR